MVTNSSSMFDLARKHMVDSQLRPNKVTDERVLGAMSILPRESFVPAGLIDRAYADENIRLGGGRSMMAPMGLARLIQEAGIEANERVLLIGVGSGYGAAVIAATGAEVVALEQDPALLAIARATLPAHAPTVQLAEATLANGWAQGAPYDCILIEGAAAELSAALLAQLAPQGRVVMVQDRGQRIGVAAVGVKTAQGMSFAPKFDCMAAVLPGFGHEAAFVF
jgi:protein-L-isoaspartate(D-aspartate) O-methyltransferase